MLKKNRQNKAWWFLTKLRVQNLLFKFVGKKEEKEVRVL